MPKDCITLDGLKPEFLLEYDMQEHPKNGYPPRTEANVKDSDGTLRFAANFGSAGERCTLKAIKWYNKPYFDVDISNLPPKEEIIIWITENKIKVLNIAGNSELTSPGIGDLVFEYLCDFFKDLKCHEGHM
jgi:hypothetical protein